MRRYYRVNAECKGLTEKQLMKVMTREFCWGNIRRGFDKERGISGFSGEGFLCGWRSVEEAHKQIVKEMRKINKKAIIGTTWGYWKV